MKLIIRRRIRRPPDLTSLFDVLFIVVFVALIRAAAAQQAEAEARRPPPVKPVPPQPRDVAVLRTRALANLGADLAARTPLVVRISASNVIEELEANGKRVPLDVPLLEQTRDPDVPLAYLGDRSSALQVCAIAAAHFALPDLTRYLVIVAPAQPFARLPVVLVEGLHHDFDRCLIEQHGLATLVDPGAP